MSLLDVKRLSVGVRKPDRMISIVRDVSFSLDKGETVGIVGESGSGKSITALAIMRLLEDAICEGEVLFEGRNLLTLPESDLRGLRGRYISMIFQDASISLNPIIRVGEQIAEPLGIHFGKKRSERRARAIELLRRVGVPAPELRVDAWPYELSGGLKQRVMIATALACEPALLIADEPTTALDVTVQAQVVDLLKSLQKTTSMGILLISHDLGFIAEVSDRILVLYSGEIVESGPTTEVLAAPRHPYTAGLLTSTPSLDAGIERLHEIPGSVPDILNRPSGCAFHDRCSIVREKCSSIVPDWHGSNGRGHRCMFPLEKRTHG